MLISKDSKKVKAKLWFSKVSNAHALSAYKLDHIFNQFPDRTKSDRLRMFQSVKNGVLPSFGNHPKRKFNLVNIVGKTEGYEESREIFTSIFWEFASDKLRYTNMYEFRNFAVKCIEAAVSSADLETQIKDTRYLVRELPIQFNQKKIILTKIKLPNFLLTKPNLDQLAAIGVLYREAYLSCSIRYSEDLKALYLEKLNEFLKEPWIADSIKIEFYNLATKILCPIMQFRRNRMESILDKLESKNLNRDTKKFLRDHHAAARYDKLKKIIRMKQVEAN
jgi:hypothetical protein